MTTFAGITPSSDSQVTPVYRVQEYTYGNGYKAYAPDGANGTIVTAQVNFDYLTTAQSTALEAWFAANPPWVTWSGDGVLLSASLTFRVTKDGWQKTVLPGGINQYQFDIEQVF
jgi:phage-related protein